MEDGIYSCRLCSNKWSAQSAAHCAADCHETFSGVTFFDAHRKAGTCLDPESLGLGLVFHEDMWITPEAIEQREAFAARVAAAAAAKRKKA